MISKQRQENHLNYSPVGGKNHMELPEKGLGGYL